jgi:hypothetical protein
MTSWGGGGIPSENSKEMKNMYKDFFFKMEA